MIEFFDVRDSREVLVQVAVVSCLKRSNPGRIPFGDKKGQLPDDYLRTRLELELNFARFKLGKVADCSSCTNFFCLVEFDLPTL